MTTTTRTSATLREGRYSGTCPGCGLLLATFDGARCARCGAELSKEDREPMAIRMSILYCAALNVFRLSNLETGKETTATPAEIDSEENRGLRGIVAYARKSPDRAHVFNIPNPKKGGAQ